MLLEVMEKVLVPSELGFWVGVCLAIIIGAALLG
jgi:hypothetical protein